MRRHVWLGSSALALAALFAGTGTGAMAASAIVSLGPADSLDNFDFIDGSGVSWGVLGTSNVATILNESSGRIRGGTQEAISVNGTTDTFINDGTIEGGDSDAIGLGGVGSFRNSGVIGAENGYAIAIAGDAGAIVNTASGVIWSDLTSTGGIVVAGDVGSFSNAGSIDSHLEAIEIGGDVGDFTNNGELRGGYDTSSNDVTIHGAVTGTFRNAAGGTIDGTGYSDGSAVGVSIEGEVNRFVNDGTIKGLELGVEFGSTVADFSNGGLIVGGSGAGVQVTGHVGSFVNTAGGEISATSSGYGAVALADGVDSFDNAGWIHNDVSDGVGAVLSGTIGSVVNTGTGRLAGDAVGAVIVDSSVAALVNDGEMTGSGDSSYGLVVSDSSVGSLRNAGTLRSAGTGESAGLAIEDSLVDSFINTSTGRIEGTYGGLALSDASILSFSNAGYIDGPGFAGIAVSDTDVTIVNTGTIEGATGILYDGTYAGSGRIVNSGVIRGSAGTAIDFDYDPGCGCGSPVARDDTLTLLTGSQIFGDVNFGLGAADTLDFSGFAGNTLLRVPGLDAVAPGGRTYAWNQTADTIAIADLSGMSRKAAGVVFADIVQSLGAVTAEQLAAPDAVEPLAGTPFGYAADVPRTPASRAAAGEAGLRTDLAGSDPAGSQGWATVIGGGSAAPDVNAVSALYGGLVAGVQTRFGKDMSLGGMVGLVQSRTSAVNGSESAEISTGLVGVYGNAGLGLAAVDVALTGGFSVHATSRQIVALGGTQTATGLFESGFLAPSAGLSIPVLAGGSDQLSLKLSASYVGGLTTGYTETGSAMNLMVGSQLISLLTGHLGLEERHTVAAGDGATVALTARAGVLVEADFGSASVPVIILGQGSAFATPGGTSYGVYAGLGADSAIGRNLDLAARIDGSYLAGGNLGVAAKATLSAAF